MSWPPPQVGIELGQSSGEHVISEQCEKCRRSHFDLLDRAHIVNIGGCRYDGITDCRRWPVFARHASSTLLYGYYGTIPGPHSAVLDHWLRREQPQRTCWLEVASPDSSCACQPIAGHVKKDRVFDPVMPQYGHRTDAGMSIDIVYMSSSSALGWSLVFAYLMTYRDFYHTSSPAFHETS